MEKQITSDEFLLLNSNEQNCYYQQWFYYSNKLNWIECMSEKEAEMYKNLGHEVNYCYRLIDNLRFTTKYGAETEIRALSWKQPYLDLMLHGKIETRTWPTNYRGWVLMCSSKQAYGDAKVLNISGNFNYGRVNRLVTQNRLGQALAIGRLVDCRPMQPDDEAKTFVQYRAPWEEIKPAPGWSRNPDRAIMKQIYCHIYEDVQAIEPMPWVGCQGWRKVSDIFKAGIIIK